MTYLSEEQIFQDILLYKLSEKQKEEFKSIEADDLIMLHHGFGMWIRNNYDLWKPENPNVVLLDSFHENFPDQISQRIIERLWCQLTGKEIKERLEVKQTGPNTYQIGKVTIQMEEAQPVSKRTLEEIDGTE